MGPCLWLVMYWVEGLNSRWFYQVYLFYVVWWSERQNWGNAVGYILCLRAWSVLFLSLPSLLLHHQELFYRDWWFAGSASWPDVQIILFLCSWEGVTIWLYWLIWLLFLIDFLDVKGTACQLFWDENRADMKNAFICFVWMSFGSRWCRFT